MVEAVILWLLCIVPRLSSSFQPYLASVAFQVCLVPYDCEGHEHILCIHFGHFICNALLLQCSSSPELGFLDSTMIQTK